MRLGGAVELGLVVGEAADHRQHAAGERVHRDAGAGDLRNLAQADTRRPCRRPARHRRRRRAWRAPSACLPVHFTPSGVDGSGLALGAERARLVVLGLQADADRRVGDVEHHREPPRLDVAVFGNVAERHAPVLAEVDRLDRAVPAMRLVVAHQPVDQRLARHQLQLGVERRAHRKAALVELLLAVALGELAPHFLGEEAGGDRIGRQHARRDDQRLGARRLAPARR